MISDFFYFIVVKKNRKTFIHNYLFCLNSEEQKYKEIYTNEINKLKTLIDSYLEKSSDSYLIDVNKNTNAVTVGLHLYDIDDKNILIDNKVKISSLEFELLEIKLLSINNKYIKKLKITGGSCVIFVNCKNIQSLNIGFVSKNIKLSNTSYISSVHINDTSVSDDFIYCHFVNTKNIHIKQTIITAKKNILDFSNFINAKKFLLNFNTVNVSQENKINIITPPNVTILHLGFTNSSNTLYILNIQNMAMLTEINFINIYLTNSIYLSQIPKIKLLNLFGVKHTDPSKNIIIFDSPVKNLDFLNIYKCNLDYDEFFNNLQFFPKLTSLYINYKNTVQKPINLDFSALTMLKTLSLTYNFSLNCKIKNIFPLSLKYLLLSIKPVEYDKNKKYIFQQYNKHIVNNAKDLILDYFFFYN